jgi:hypothetical protein
MTQKDDLIDGLMHNAEASGNQMLERRLADTAVWFHKNVDHIPRDNLASRQAFLEKGFWCMLEINVLLLQRLREERGAKNLWLPKGITMNGDLKRFG